MILFVAYALDFHFRINYLTQCKLMIDSYVLLFLLIKFVLNSPYYLHPFSQR